MRKVVVGLNYRLVPVEIREKFVFTEEQLPQALHQLKAKKSILECVIVATCNRTEIYAVVDQRRLCGHDIRLFLEEWFHIPREQFMEHLYTYEEEETIRHLMKVACGLDSMVLGETQILGQVRDAFMLAQRIGTTGTLFNTLFRQTITVAKRAHAETSISENAVSVSYASVELAKRQFGGKFRNKKVAIVGAGDVGELTLKHLISNGANKIFVVNRTMETAEKLAKQFNGQAIPFNKLESMLSELDIIISSTGSTEPILTKQQVERNMAARDHRPLFLIDIAVPRDFDPAISELRHVHLYDIDDLQGVIQANLAERERDAFIVEKMIQEEIVRFQQWYRTLGVGPVIQALQEKAANIHEETMTNLLNRLPDLDEREVKVIQKLTKSMLNQMIHEPILKLKDLAATKNGASNLNTFAKIFALEETLEDLESELKLRTVMKEKRSIANIKSLIVR